MRLQESSFTLQKIVITCFTILICLLFGWTCKYDKFINGTDKKLLTISKELSGYVWFKKSDALLNRSASSGHSQPFLRTRYNAIAAGKLDATGNIIVGSVFDEGSIIVKELYTNNTTIGRYAILLKDKNDIYADKNGWVWGYVNSDGSVAESAANKGAACINCHSQTGNIDYMLMNKYFP